MRRDLFYIVLCLILPAVWGVISAQVFDRCQSWLSRRRESRSPGTSVVAAEEAGPDMYHI